MKDCVLQRVVEIMRYKSFSEREFANLIGANQKTINQQMKQDRSLSLDTVLSIISSFEDISVEWLLRGTGEMLLSESSSQDSPIIEDSNSFYERMIDKKDKRIEELALLVGNLQKEVEMLKRDKKIAPEMGDALGVVERMKPTGTEGL